MTSGYGSTGPSDNKSGGVQIGNTGIWVSDYTTEPENGGLGVFAHEFGHDLGLPDLYDTTGAGDNSVAYWSLMSSGSWLGDGKEAIGTTPGYMGAWEKLQLGWNDVQSVGYGKSTAVKLGPADKDNKNKPQAVAVNLPDQQVTTKYNTPKSGSYEWWSGRGNSLNNTLGREIDLTGATKASISAATWYEIEEDYDYLYAQVSTDDGATWTNVGSPLTGEQPSWGSDSWDLSAYAGKKIQFRFAYQTDGGLAENGAFLDDIALTIDGTTTTDDVEAGVGAWTAKGFTRMTGSSTEDFQRYYLAEYRRYSDYDATLKTGPYNFGFADQPDKVEHFPYQDGLLVWYVNDQYEDNNVTEHPGYGQVLPVDAHPRPHVWKTNELTSNRINSYDSTFTKDSTDAFTLHRKGTSLKFPAQKGVSTFDDTYTNGYWYSQAPTASVKVAGTGTKIAVQGKQGDGLKVQVTFKR